MENKISPTSKNLPHTTGSSYRREFQNRSRQPPPPTEKRSRNLDPASSSQGSRERVQEILKLFRERCKEISRNGKRGRVDMKAYTELKKRLPIPSANYIGAAPGVEVGDRFEFRAELILTGIHGKLQNGIDFLTLDNRTLATCVVSKIGYKDKMNDPDSLVYRGEGGLTRGNGGSKIVFFDQKMKYGNLALKHSMKDRKDVRVLRGVQDPRKISGRVVYVYDGLYRVDRCEKNKGERGNMVYDFYLRRNSGQKSVDWKRYSLQVD